jgi:Methyltransferase domain
MNERLLLSYPKSRPPLSDAHWRVYEREYTQNRCSAAGVFSAVRQLETWMHDQVSARQKSAERLLEIGAGTLNHLPYEKSFLSYEVVEPFESLWRDSPYRQKVNVIYSDIGEVPESNRYDRIVSIAVLEHLAELPWVVAKTAVHLAEGGAFVSAIPSEGHLLWGLGWRFITGVAYRLRTGLNYAAVMRHEHINTAAEILSVVSHFYSSVSIRRFPTRIPALSFYTAFRAERPLVSVAQEFLRERPYAACQPAHVRGSLSGSEKDQAG